jgi:UDP-N-acetylmuramate: L-alanyl-gamma-D-glutamyl-meso-diaminopimelate ligase
MHVHLVGVAGTGMGALAGLLQRAGHRVSGSDVAFHPPMGDALARWKIDTRTGYSAQNLVPRPDVVVVGNVCRSDNVEAREALDAGIRTMSMPDALAHFVLRGRPSWVVAGTHGKTTTTALVAHLADASGLEPGYLIGGIPVRNGESFALGDAEAPFVVEGDEYDSAFFQKTPKFWGYEASASILTSIEHDHLDIYPTRETYEAAFAAFVERLPENGLLVAFAGDEAVRRVAARARCRVVYYALSRDDVGDLSPTWIAAPIAAQGGMQPMDLFVGGTSCGPVLSPLVGDHNVRNTLGAIALLAETSEGTRSVNELASALRNFAGVKRRQELVGVARGIRVYDDFAHHPTAVRETTAALRQRHPEGRLIAVFEPRSATACRTLHQREYAESFFNADRIVLAPLGRTNVPEDERLNVARLASDLRERGLDAHAASDFEQVVRDATRDLAAGDTILVMSNGAFGGLHDVLLAKLALP